VLDKFSIVFPLFSTKSETVKDIGILLALGCFWKLLYIVGVYYKSSRVSKFYEK